MLDNKTMQRFENALPMGFGALRELARSLADEGLSHVAICHIFDLFGTYLREVGRDEEAGYIWVCVENIFGWRSQESWWFGRRLTMDEVLAYRKAIGYPPRPIGEFWIGQRQ